MAHRNGATYLPRMSYPGHKTISGWGVYRMAPWHFVGVFSREEGIAKAAQLGGEYVCALGEQRAGSDDFIALRDPEPRS